MMLARWFVVSLLIVMSLSSIAFAQASTPPPPLGRYHLVVVTGHAGSPFLVDTATGCVWHLVQNNDTKRSAFVEVDVENLHWSWGSGSQQLLAARVDAANLTDDQKRALKQEVQKTGCGVSPVVLTPTITETPRPAAEPSRTPEPGRPPIPRR